MEISLDNDTQVESVTLLVRKESRGRDDKKGEQA